MMKQESLYLAPLAGYTDMAFRHSCMRQGLKRGYTALIDAGALVYGNRENSAILQRGDDEEWLGVQLLGSRLDFLEAAAPMLDRMNYDEVNFNMGCPVRKVIQREAGAALLKNPDHALECIRLIRRLVTHHPLTVKLRILDEGDVDATVSFCRMLEREGVEALAIHGRIAAKVYSGPVAVDIIRTVRENVSIPVTANGGIFTREDAEALSAATGCERVMVARGAIGNPWLFRSILTGETVVPSRVEVCDEIRRHVVEMTEIYGEDAGIVNARKIILGYMGGRGFHRTLKPEVCSLKTLLEFEEFLCKLQRDAD